MLHLNVTHLERLG